MLQRGKIDDAVWLQVLARHRCLDGLTESELLRLRELSTIFIHEKSIQGAAGVVVDEAMRVTIAAQACLLVLNLGSDSYDGWVEVILYPDEFRPQIQWEDENGVVHVGHEPHTGESWLRGPVILSWANVATGEDDGVNIVIHEFAHKLDMLNGDANGFPPLHAGMDRDAWTHAFTTAFDDFRVRVDRGDQTAIDPYAAESAAEFFAVLSESFFETPEVVEADYPRVYAQLAAFYRQDPIRRRVRSVRSGKSGA